jgi:hypothetical protein
MDRITVAGDMVPFCWHVNFFFSDLRRTGLHWFATQQLLIIINLNLKFN